MEQKNQNEIRSLFIPVRESDEWVEVYVDELPNDVNDIIDVLRAEIAPLGLWLQFAVEYYKQGFIDQFQEILSVASEPGIESIYSDEASRISRIKIFNALAGHSISLMWNETDPKNREIMSQQAINFFQKADRIDPQFPMTLVGKALMFLAKGEDDRAFRFLENILKINQENLPAILGKGMFYYRKKKYREAIECFRKAIELYPHSPQKSQMRLAYGYCLYKMKNLKKSTALVKRAFDLDDANVDAIVAHAMMQLENRPPLKKYDNMFKENSRFMTMIQRAHMLDPRNPIVLNQLANHYFLQWTPLMGTFNVVQGSCLIITSQDISNELSPGQMIRIGDTFIAYISESKDAITSTTIQLDHPYQQSSQDHVLISKKLYDRMIKLAGSAYHSTQIDQVKAESCYLMGRAYHAQGRYSDAYTYYFNAVRLWPECSLACFGLAQMYYYQGYKEKAIQQLEKALTNYPDNPNILFLLACLYTENNMKRNECIENFRRVAELQPANIEALIGTARLFQLSMDSSSDYKIALNSYIATEKILQNTHRVIPYELYVNTGVLHQRLGNINEAKEFYQKALKQIQCMENNKENQNKNELIIVNEHNITIVYNMGLLEESQGKFKEAKEFYQMILNKFPKYTDALLRIGCIQRNCGEKQLAFETFKQVLSLNPTCADANALIGNIHFESREWSLAQKRFELNLGLKSGSLKNDPYTLLSMGNIFLSNLEEKGKYIKNLDLSFAYYKKILQLQPSNFYAANGIGIVMVEKSHFEAAIEVFSQVRQSHPNVPDAWINLAHLYVAEERYDEAIQLYQVCSQTCYHGQDVEVLLYLANVLHLAKRFKECISTLVRALHIKPREYRFWFNLALSLEEYACSTLGQDTNKVTGIRRTLNDVKRAIGDLNRSERIFSWLMQTTQNEKIPFERKKVDEHVRFCKETVVKANAHLEFELQQEEKRKGEAQAQQMLIEQMNEKTLMRQQAARMEEEKIAMTRREVALKKQERLDQLSAAWKEKEVEKVEKKSSRGAKRKKGNREETPFSGSDNEDDEFDQDEDMNDPKMLKLIEKKKQRKQKRSKENDEDKLNDLFGSESSGEEEFEPTPMDADAAETEKQLFGSDDDE